MIPSAAQDKFVAPWWPAGLLAAVALWLLTYPFNFAPEGINPWLGDPWVGKLNTLSNVIMFFPFGLLAGWAMRTRGIGTVAGVVGVTFAALSTSVVGETLQVWLPDRHSAVIDLIANSVGAALGAGAIPFAEPLMSNGWSRIARWLSDSPAAKRAVWAIALWGAVRMWPFNFAVETYYLRQNLQASADAGWPFTSIVELVCGAAAFVVTAMMLVVVCRAMRETFERRGDFGSPAMIAGGFGFVAVAATEMLNLPIRGRVMDLSELFAGWAAVPAALIFDAMFGSRKIEAMNPAWQAMDLPRDKPTYETKDRATCRSATAAVFWVAIGVTLLTVYGSLVPLTMKHLSLHEAMSQYRMTMGDFASSRPSRADVATNFILFGAMAFAWMALAGHFVRSAVGRVGIAGVILVMTVGSGAVLEFVQLFIVERTTSPYDVASQMAGGVVGLGVWMSRGDAWTAPLSGMFAGRAGAGRAVLTIYLLGYLFYAVMPLDIVMSPGELLGKFRNGHVKLIPFTYDWPSVASALWDLARDLTLAIPIGMWAVVSSRTTRSAAIRAGAIFVGIECVQLLLASRVTDSTDVVTGLNGAAIGAMALHFTRSGSVKMSPMTAMLCAVVYALGLVVFYWLPFDLELSRLTWLRVREQVMVLPLSRLYLEGSFPALDQMLVKVLVVTPMGMLIAMMVRRRGVQAVLGVMVVGWLTVIEFVQVASASRVGDSTDILLGGVGLIIGVTIGSIVRREKEAAARQREVEGYDADETEALPRVRSRAVRPLPEKRVTHQW